MFSTGQTIRTGEPGGAAGKVFLSLFGLIFMGAGLLFLALMLRDAGRGLQTWTWQKTDCTITSSGVGQEDPNGKHTGEFYIEIRYRYTYGGKPFSSDSYQRKPAAFEDYGKASRLAAKYPVGENAICYVNPATPAESVLVRYNLFSLLTVLFPMVFVAIGGGTIYFAWRRKPVPKDAGPPISDQIAAPRHRWVLHAFFSVFLLVGAGVGYGFFFRPVCKIISARNWPAVPCLVHSSEVRTTDGSGDDGPTYAVNIFYSYTFSGREYKGNTYSFFGGSSTGYEGKQAVVAQHPPGSKTVCYVNPGDPTDAVLERGFIPEMWFGLIPLVFFFVGAGGLVYSIRTHRSGTRAGVSISAPAKPGFIGHSSIPTRSTESAVLKPKASPWMKLLGVVFACLFWNGIISAFASQVVHGWRNGAPEWGLTIFLIPFAAIGVGLAGAVFYFFMALFNPRPRLKVTPSAVPLGQTLDVNWTFAGRSGALRKLLLYLEGREEATYSRGSSSVTDKNVFFSQVLVNTQTPREIGAGETRMTIPTRLAPSFAGKNNKIIWAIHLHGEIPWWPDVKEEFAVTVLPPARPGGKL